MDWVPLVPRSPLKGDAPHVFPVSSGQRCTHVRLRIYPDGGIARLRLHGSLTDSGLGEVRRRWAETAAS